jgi:hypothetical protein
LELELKDTKSALDLATSESGDLTEMKKLLKIAKLKTEESNNEVNRLTRLNAKFQAQLEETQKLAQDKVCLCVLVMFVLFLFIFDIIHPCKIYSEQTTMHLHVSYTYFMHYIP